MKPTPIEDDWLNHPGTVRLRDEAQKRLRASWRALRDAALESTDAEVAKKAVNLECARAEFVRLGGRGDEL